jgi:RNA-directed DNA polymerase
MQTSLFDIENLPLAFRLSKEDLFAAYYDCRRNKRNSRSAMEYESSYESNLLQLHEKIINGNYKPAPGFCFIIKKPVKREVFAPAFRDRVVHHLLYNYLSPIFEKTFIHDSYSCRKGKGTHYGIKRVDHFIRSCSDNYRKNCYILKLDIKGYFMSIDRALLFDKLKSVLLNQKQNPEFGVNLVLYLLEKVIFNDPTTNCIVKGKKTDWDGLPASKSLFHAGYQKGLPIGNLTSQLFGNVYLNDFDHFVKRDLGIRYYGRYVDDFVLIHSDKCYLNRLIPIITEYLSKKLHLTLHPDKVYLQHFSKGVKFLGAFIKPHRAYVANRIKGNFYEAIKKQSALAIHHKPDAEERAAFRSVMNSYLGIMKHYKTYKLRKRMIWNNLSAWWWNHVYVRGGYARFVIRNYGIQDVYAPEFLTHCFSAGIRGVVS